MANTIESKSLREKDVPILDMSKNGLPNVEELFTLLFVEANIETKS